MKLACGSASKTFPITPKAHGTEFLMDHRHLWLRSSRQWAILRIRARIIRAMRDWLDNAGFLLVDTPILTAAAGEETTTLFEIDYFGERAYLAQTGQLYNEANIAAFGKSTASARRSAPKNPKRAATCSNSGCSNRRWPSIRSKT